MWIIFSSSISKKSHKLAALSQNNFLKNSKSLMIFKESRKINYCIPSSWVNSSRATCRAAQWPRDFSTFSYFSCRCFRHFLFYFFILGWFFPSENHNLSSFFSQKELIFKMYQQVCFWIYFMRSESVCPNWNSLSCVPKKWDYFHTLYLFCQAQDRTKYTLFTSWWWILCFNGFIFSTLNVEQKLIT